MRHRKVGKKLGREKGPRKALTDSLATSLVLYEKIVTTEAKAKALRPIVEKLITRSKVKSVHNKQMLGRDLEDKKAVQKLLVYQWDKYGPKLNDLGLNNDKLKFYFEETMLMLMNWCKYFLADIKQLIKEKNISVQEAFTELTPVREQKFSSEEYSVRGFIDAVHHCGDEIHILDYKTNARFDMKESIKLQLAIYSLLYQEKKGVMPHKVGIFFLRHKSKYMNVEPGLIELAKREINSIHSHTSSTEHVDDYPQTITPLCKWSTGQCDYYHACKPHG